MRDHGIAHDAAALEQRWLLRIQGLALALGRVPVVWEEAFGSAGGGLDPKTLVHVWKWWSEDRDGEEGATARASARRRLMTRRAEREGAGRPTAAEPPPSGARGLAPASPGPIDPTVWAARLAAVTAAGHGALLSAPWYLNLGTFAGEDWKRYYAADPAAFPAMNATQVLGGMVRARGEAGRGLGKVQAGRQEDAQLVPPDSHLPWVWTTSPSHAKSSTGFSVPEHTPAHAVSLSCSASWCWGARRACGGSSSTTAIRCRGAGRLQLQSQSGCGLWRLSPVWLQPLPALPSSDAGC